MPVPFGRGDKGRYRDVWTVRGLEPVPRRVEGGGEGKGRGGKARQEEARLVEDRGLAEVRGKAGQKRTVLLWMRFFFLLKNGRGKNAAQTRVLLKRGHWGSFNRAGAGAGAGAGQGRDRTIGPAGPSQGAKGAGCSRVEIVWGLREMRTGGSEARYPGIQVPRAGARTSERQCHTVPSVAASGTKWSEVALKVGMRFQGRLVQQAVGLPSSPRRKMALPQLPKS
jgi:hypothetical protein